MVVRAKTNNVVSVGDQHGGCQLGLCPPEFRLDNGGIYKLSKFQEFLWDCWCEFWTEWVEEVTHKEEYDIVVGGDAIEGRHHNATTQITQNLADQRRIATANIQWVLDHAKRIGRVFYVRGTPAHGGEAGEDEETMAKDLGCVPTELGQHARNDLWIEMGKAGRHNALVHILHHIGATGVAAYESTAIHREVVEELQEAARWGQRPPDMVVRHHRHRGAFTGVQGGNGIIVGLVNPGWQGKTPHAWKISGGRTSTPQFGGSVLRSGDMDSFFRMRVWNLARSKAE